MNISIPTSGTNRAMPRYDNCQEAAVNAAPRPITPFEQIEYAAAEVGALASRVAALAGKLVGEVPNTGTAKDDPCRSGQLGMVADRADRISYAVRQMHDDLSRIEEQLP